MSAKSEIKQYVCNRVKRLNYEIQIEKDEDKLGKLKARKAEVMNIASNFGVSTKHIEKE